MSCSSSVRPSLPRRALASATFTAAGVVGAAGVLAGGQVAGAAGPNVVIVNIDDMGWGDFGAYGNNFSQTPNVNALADQGTRFTQFYASSPICSPSRAGLFTGQFSARNHINTFLAETSFNRAADNVNHLGLDAPSMARAFRDGGYATGHFGKWHLGGGRDVGYEGTLGLPFVNATVPKIVEYGYDAAWTQFEGLGNRIINVADGATAPYANSEILNFLNRQSRALGDDGGRDQLVYIEREFNAQFMVDRAIDFINATGGGGGAKPFFMNVWFDEVHTPHDPPPALKAKYDALYPSLPNQTRQYLAVLEETDRQIGRLVDHIDASGLGNQTLILVTADNGAEAVNANAIGSNGPFRGEKGDVFEGGIRAPLVARWTGRVTPGRVDGQTVMAMTDLFPSLADVADLAPPAGADFDGENLSAALLGDAAQARTNSLFWNVNRGIENRHDNGGEEAVALRSGDYKLIVDTDGSRPMLYDLSTDLDESNNLAGDLVGKRRRMQAEALTIRYDTPSRRLPDFDSPIVHLRADDLDLFDGQGVAGWNDGAGGDPFNGSVGQGDPSRRPTFRADALNGRAAIEFDGVDDVLISSANNALGGLNNVGFTVFVVAEGDASGETAERAAQFGSRTGDAGQIVALDLSTSDPAATNGGSGLRFNDGANLHDAGLDAGEFHILAFQIAPGGSYEDATLFVDGTRVDNRFTGDSNNPDGRLDLSGTDLELILGTGRGPGGGLFDGDYYTGQIAELVAYNFELDLLQMNLVGNYLGSEYGLDFAYSLEGVALLPGDANGDDRVTIADFAVLRSNFGETGNVFAEDGDFNGDGSVTIADFAILRANFGGGASDAAILDAWRASIPEPTFAAGVYLPALMLCRRRRR